MQSDKKLYMPMNKDDLQDPEDMLQVQPLIEDNKDNEQSSTQHQHAEVSQHEVNFRVFNEDEESTKITKLICLKQSYVKMIIVVPILAICTGLFFLLFMYWYPKLRKMFLYSECSMHNATHLFVVGTMGHMEVVALQNKNAEIFEFISPTDRQAYEQSPFLIFVYRFIKYQFDYLNDCFSPIVFDCNVPYQTIHSKYSQGIQSEPDYKIQLIKYGKCNIEIPIKSIPRLLVEEILNPFYLFQIFSMALWYWDGYRSYATCILLISVTSAVTSLYETLSNLKNIRKMAHYSCPVNIMRNGDEHNLIAGFSEELVPGDVIEIPENSVMPCDMVVLTGSCIVNESMLTGESIPVIKNSLPFANDLYNPDEDNKYTLYGGTKVIQTRRFGTSKVLGLVIRTAFVTTKGNLVRDILYPKPNKFKFYADSLKFIFVMGLLAIAGFLATLPIMLNQGFETWAIVDRSLDLITITVPPALPAAMTAGTAFAIARLKKKRIYCISPPRVNVSGRVNLMVFDKTGTLTEDGLQVFGYRGVEKAIIHNQNHNIFGQFQPDCRTYQPDNKWWNDALLREELENDTRTLLLEGLATCHSITYVGGELIGDPLDVKMFQATGWTLEEPVHEGGNADELILAYCKHPLNSQPHFSKNQRADSMLSMSDISQKDLSSGGGGKDSNYQLALIRRFDFSSKLQRMSVIVKNFLDHSFKTFVKGSPERIRELCSEESLPQNYDEILEIYTECGYRVLALAYKPLNINFLKSQKMPRDEVECDLQFLGFLIMQNKLKPVTVSVIQTLNQANIRTIMATGDNVLTAISVGRECNIIEGDAEVFLGETRKEGDKEVVFWKSTKNDRHKLQPNTLIPNQQFYSDEQRRPGYNTIMRMEIEQSKEEDQESVNDIVSLEDFPWQHPPEAYGIAITGKAFNILLNDESQQAILKQVLMKAQIYARMSPDDKAKLVEKLQQFCKTEVGMCGDGANDCGALKTADVGLSLSEAEASIAAPFTSQIQDISAIVVLLREGRCALTTSFQCFKFIELYSMIQFVTVTLLYSVGSNLSDFQFLYIDLFVLIPLSIFMGSTDAYKTLTPHLPAGSLLSLPVLVSVLGSTVIQSFFQAFMFFYIKWWSFYTEPHINPDDPEASYQCYENTSLMYVASFQYLVVCMVFSISKPFRQPLYTNIPFTISLGILFIFNAYLTLSNDGFVTWLLDLEQNVTMTFRLSACVIIGINGLMTYLFEKFIVWYVSIWWKTRKDRIKHAKQQAEIKEQQDQIAIDSQKRTQSKYQSKLISNEVEMNSASPKHQTPSGQKAYVQYEESKSQSFKTR